MVSIKVTTKNGLVYDSYDSDIVILNDSVWVYPKNSIKRVSELDATIGEPDVFPQDIKSVSVEVTK